jgi:hypothetical protein
MSAVSHAAAIDYLEDLLDAAEIEAIAREPRAQLRERLAAKGADVRRVLAAKPKPVTVVVPPAPPAAASTEPAKVIPIAKARPNHVGRILRMVSVAVAASFFGIFVWREGSMSVGTFEGGRAHPSRDLSDTAPLPPRSPMVEKAAALRAQAKKLCRMQYWGECEDKLDEAMKLDRSGDGAPEVVQMRRWIESWRTRQRITSSTDGAYSKPPIGPGERPLQRRPH